MDPLDLTQYAVWRCQSCPSTLPSLQVSAQERDLMMELNGLERDDIRGMEDFLSRHRKQLHPNHASLMEVKKHLSTGYGLIPGFTLEKLSLEKVKKKVGFCREIIDVLTILEPGISTQKGLTLYELWKGEVEIAERLSSEDKLDKEGLKKALEEALVHLEQSACILKYEPENSIHGKTSLDVDIKLEDEKKTISKL